MHRTNNGSTRPSATVGRRDLSRALTVWLAPAVVALAMPATAAAAAPVACPAGDPNVVVDTHAKTYAVDHFRYPNEPVTAHDTGSKPGDVSAMHAKMAGMPTMCESKAARLGLKPVTMARMMQSMQSMK